MLKATIDATVGIGAVKPEELERAIVDTTVQDKAIAHPVDSRLLEIARHKPFEFGVKTTVLVLHKRGLMTTRVCRSFTGAVTRA